MGRKEENEKKKKKDEELCPVLFFFWKNEKLSWLKFHFFFKSKLQAEK